jgi:ribosomal protein S18 acetylase RimI-like enzyme
MDTLLVRPAISSDIPFLVAFDHHYSTDHVWQMGYVTVSGEIGITFREVRLPRAMRVEYPRDPSRLPDEWTHKAGMLVGVVADERLGYVCMVEGPASASVWMTDLVVDARHRRQGVGSRLLATACDWAAERRYDRVFLELQTKNFAAISLARKGGFDFAGYSDRYFPDQDIAIFFSRELRSGRMP